jgi:hypothetical protein
MDTTSTPSTPKRHQDRGSIIGGLVLVVMGLLFLANNLLPDFRFHDYWPVILIVIGAGLLWKSRTPSQQ